MNNNTALLGLLAETSIHAGAGQMVGVIDLPIQREAHTDWPVVYGSAVKGALRALAEEQGAAASWIVPLFGPDTANSSDHAGALLVGDARLLLLPVRSLTSHFKWVTCPALLRRFRTDAERLSLRIFPANAIPPVEDAGIALVPGGQAEALFLEEFRFAARPTDLLEAVIPDMARLMGRDDAADALQRQLVVVDDDRFSHLARFATPVNAHVCLDNETKTVKTGALWYEESLPPDTVLYVGLYAHAARTKDNKMSATKVLRHVIDDLFNRPYLQLGGNETVGMGWCKVTIWRGEG